MATEVAGVKQTCHKFIHERNFHMKAKKFLVSALLSLSVLGGAMSLQAASDKILVGTPTIDGKVDEIYTNSLTLETGKGKNAYDTEWADANGKIYFLYDDKYLYICADIKDDDVLSKGADYVKGENPWENDCCEFRLSLDGGTTTIKVGIDAYGLRAYGLKANEEIVDYSKIVYKTTHTDTSYVIEAAIPCTEGVLDMKSAGKLGFKLQLNDFTKDNKILNFATDYAGEGPKGLVFYELSTEKVSSDATGDTSKPSTETNTSGAETAPATADIFSLCAIAATVSGGIIVAKKKH